MSKNMHKPTVLIGRKEELHKLEEIYHDVTTNIKSRVVLIEGPLGIGKTALVEYFLQSVKTSKSRQADPLIGIGKCTFESQMVGLQPFAQMLSHMRSDKYFEATIGSVLKFVAECAPAWADVFTQGAVTKTIKAASTTLAAGNSQFIQQHKLDISLAYTEFARIIGNICQKRPVIGFIDDFHLADQSSTGLLKYLADPQNPDGFAEIPAMIIVSYRPEGAVNALLQDIDTEPRLREQFRKIRIAAGIPVLDYVQSVYPGLELPKRFTDEVEKRASGNPLLLQQLFSFLVLSENIKPGNGDGGDHSWTASPQLDSADFIHQILQQNVTESLDAVLFGKYRLLQRNENEPELYELLSFASVEGECFSAQGVAALSGRSLEHVFQSLEKLENTHQMVRRAENRVFDIVSGKALDTYHFNPLILQDIIYRNLSPGQQRTRHQQMANFLEGYAKFEQTYSVLAVQYEKAKEPFQAASYALKAAQYEQSQSKVAEAEKWCQFGLKQLEGVALSEDIQKLRLELLKAVGDCFFYSGEYGEAADRYSGVLSDPVIKVATREAAADLFAQAAHACLLAGRSNEEVIDYCKQGKANLEGIPFNQYYFALEVIRIRAYDVEKRVRSELYKALVEYGATLADDLYRNMYLALAYKWLGAELQDQGEFAESKKYCFDSMELAEKCGNIDLQTQVILNLADLYGEVGEFGAGLEYAQSGRELAVRINEIDNAAYSYAIEGNIHLQQEEYQQGVEDLQRALELTKPKSLWNMPFMYADLAICLLELQHIEEAHASARRAVKYKADKTKFGYALTALGRVLARTQAYEDSAAHFEEAIHNLTADGHRHFCAQAQYYYAEMLLQTQRDSARERATSLLKQAYAEFRQLGVKHRAKQAKVLAADYGLKLST